MEHGVKQHEATANVQLTDEDIQQVKNLEQCLDTNRTVTASLPSGALGSISFYMLRKIALPHVPWTFASQSWTIAVGYLAGVFLHRYRLALKCQNEHFPGTPPEEILKKVYLYKYLTAAQSIQLQQNVLKNKTDDELVFGGNEPISNSFDIYTGDNDYSEGFPLTEPDLSEPVNLKKEMTYDELRKLNREKTKQTPYQG